MNLFLSQNQNQFNIRPFQYRDLEAIEQLYRQANDQANSDTGLTQELEQLRRWYGLLKFLSWFPNPCQNLFNAYIAEQFGQLLGMIKVSPFNTSRSTWRIERIFVDRLNNQSSIGSQLLRYCFETLWEARTWLLEVNVNDSGLMALYRQNGFQPLAHMTYWVVEPELLQTLATTQPDLPNLLPVSNADAQLLYQLDTVSMPPLLRQVFDRHILDFKTSFIQAVVDAIKQWLSHSEQVSGYVFEPQRKAAIGYFQVQLSRDGCQPHVAELTVHPAYTWLYPELLSQMAHLAQEFGPQSLRLASADYQPEREAYLEKIGAQRVEHTLLMSRSVWHKLRESKSSLEGLQLSDVLPSWQPAHKPVPTRMSWLGPTIQHPSSAQKSSVGDGISEGTELDAKNLTQKPSDVPSDPRE
ncbi:GNAT family N-acetyltransferase [Planktothrix mougeotii]|uniref:GNAT family N-acetyltransferase n=1 Tax=Planktothrix mougeotii LEGE 06226 TaxID=1828728 RepID=A0ABR9UK04_9CYAN|nr:GNAT family N-acetyltransferase [Planktothrix mougeotii]MBE9146792.1 GNAT family N-acetyltransferase [Planktothrix mougeotii LEGE 06226]